MRAKKLNAMGIGPKIGIVALPWLAITIVLTIYLRPLFNFTPAKSIYIELIGYILLALGLVFYFSTAVTLLKGVKETRLMTKGTYAICQNPLYAAIILFIIPSVSLLINSWLILTTSLVAFILFKLTIKKEYAELEKFFGDAYKKYKETTPEFFPFIK